MVFYIKLFSFLVQGLIIGAGPCLLICAPILLPYIAGTRRSWQEGLRAVLVFGLTRTLVYGLLGSLMGYFGYYLFRFLFFNKVWGKLLWGGAGMFVILLGVLVILGEDIKSPFCRMLHKTTVKDSTRSMVLLGIVIGVTPCLPLIGILTEIMFLAKNLIQGFVFGLAFGLGTVISPLLVLGALTPALRSLIFRSAWTTRLFNILCGCLLALVGFYIIWRKVG